MVTCILKNTIIFKGFKMGTTFSRGAPTIPGWVQMLIAIENHIACDFPGGSGPSIPPLDPRMAYHVRIQSSVRGSRPRAFYYLFLQRRDGSVPIGTASANSAKFRGIKTRLHIEDLL